MNLEDQYDRIFKYLYGHLHDRQAAEDLTQEAFLRFFGSRTYRDENRQLQYLYTIARNLCRQHYRDRTLAFSLDETADTLETDSFEASFLERSSLTDALKTLSPEERELIFLRYVNQVPVTVLSSMHRTSRFAVYRKLNRILQKLRSELEKEEQGG